MTTTTTTKTTTTTMMMMMMMDPNGIPFSAHRLLAAPSLTHSVRSKTKEEDQGQPPAAPSQTSYSSFH